MYLLRFGPRTCASSAPCSLLMTAPAKNLKLQIAIAFALVYVVWGSTYLAIAVVVKTVPPAYLAAVRFLISGPLMLLVCALLGQKIGLTRNTWWRVAVIGVLLLSGGNITLAWAEKYIPSGLAALIVAVVPIWVAIIEAFILKTDRLSLRGVAGLGLGLAGLAVLLWPRLVATRAGHMSAIELIAAVSLLGGSLSWALGSVYSRRWDFGVNAFVATGWEMTFAGIANTFIALLLGELHMVRWTTEAIAGTAYLIVFGSWIGFTAYVWLLDHVPTPKVATYAYVNPVVAVFLGWLILREPLDVFTLLGAAVIVAAVVLVTSAKIKPGAVPADEKDRARLAPVETGAD